jgi:hypothetical protein
LGVSTTGAYKTQADCELDRANGGCGPTPTPTPPPTPTPTYMNMFSKKSEMLRKYGIK